MKKMTPRDKIKHFGIKSLTNEELLAVIIQTGTKEKSVYEVADCLYEKLSRLSELNELTIEELIELEGISYAKASIILASIELGKRIRAEHTKKISIDNAYDLYQFIREDIEYEKQENLIVISINIKGEIIRKDRIYIGTLNMISLSIKEVFRPIIKLNAYAMMIAHNHPSGDPKPSIQDNEFTEKIIEASKLMNIRFIDHLIIGRNQFFSYKHQKTFKV